MTNKERVIRTINHIETDYVPYSIDFTLQERERVAKYLNDDKFINRINNHIFSVYYDGWPKEMTPGTGYFKDDFGVVWNRNGTDKDIGVINGYVLPEPDLRDYKFPEPDAAELRRRLQKLVSDHPDDFKIFDLGFSLFERAWTMRGMENLLADMIEEPDFVDELLDAIADYNLKIVDIALEYDIDGLKFGDDWGQQSGLIMGPGYWRRFIKPRIARMYKKGRENGKYILQHSCGDIHEIFPDVIEIGLDVYQTFQPEIYDIKAVKSGFGGRLTFWGGISTQRLLPCAAPDEVERVTRETIGIMKPGGGYIAAPTHSVPGDVPPENIMAMLKAFENQV